MLRLQGLATKHSPARDGALRRRIFVPVARIYSFISLAGKEAIYAEALVNAYQYDLWGLLPATNENFLNQVKDYCEKGQLPMMELSGEEIERGRELLKELTEKWWELVCGEELKFEL